MRAESYNASGRRYYVGRAKADTQMDESGLDVAGLAVEPVKGRTKSKFWARQSSKREVPRSYSR